MRTANKSEVSFAVKAALLLIGCNAFAADSGLTLSRSLFDGSSMVLADAGGATGDSAVSSQSAQASGDAASEGQGASLFGGGTGLSGIGQQSVTSGYELSGIGGGGGIRRGDTKYLMTVPVAGAPIKTDAGVFLYPDVFLAQGRNDNVLGTATDKRSSSFTNLRPKFVAEAMKSGDRYTASYSGNYTWYANSSADNYANHDLWLAGDNHFTTRTHLGYGVGYLKNSDPRGATDRIQSDHPDRWHAPSAKGLFVYGAPGAIGRIEFEAGLAKKRYENNRLYTEAADLDSRTLSGRFFYRVMPKTSVLFEVRDTKNDYILSSSTADNTDRRYYLGATWEAAAATTGTVKIGRMKKDFNDSTRPGFSGGSWEADITWKPLTYSIFDFASTKTVSDATGYGNMIVSNGSSARWGHKWTSYLGSYLSAGLVKSDYQNTDRSDKVKNYAVGVTYDMRRWLQLGASWMRTDRGSTINTFDFKRNVILFSAEAAL
jgi:hypothetical protein